LKAPAVPPLLDGKAAHFARCYHTSAW